MKQLCLIVLFASAPCLAQTVENAMMPDGSRDRYVGLALVSRPSLDANAHANETVLIPQLQAQASNGIFMTGVIDTLGMHLSTTPDVEYGPLLHWQWGRSPGDYPSLAGSEEIKAGPNVGGFFNYYMGRNVRLTSELVTTTDAPGLLLNVGVQKSLPPIAPHHTLWITAGATLADQAYARHHYGVTAGPTTGGASQNYAPNGGLLNLHAGLHWNWALSAKWIIISTMSATLDAPIVADSPVTGSRNTVVMAGGLVRRF